MILGFVLIPILRQSLKTSLSISKTSYNSCQIPNLILTAKLSAQTATAQIEVDQWKDQTEAERLQIEDEAFSSFLYKLPKNCFSVALIFHCLEKVNQADFPVVGKFEFNFLNPTNPQYQKFPKVYL